MSWTGLLGFLFLTALVVLTLVRIGVKRSDFARKNNAGAFKKQPKSMWIAIAVAVIVIGYVFARKVFPQTFPDWADWIEVAVGVVLFGTLAVIAIDTKRADRTMRKKLVERELVAPKFEDSTNRSSSLSGKNSGE
jgi:protein-S-isoprenylcysteine O-methyltransferase Ste14